MTIENKDELVNDTPAENALDTDTVIKIVNQAISNHTGRLKKQTDAQFSELLAQMQAMSDASQEVKGEVAQKDTANSEMANKLKAVEARLAEEKSAREAADTQRMRTEEREALRQTLSAKGVDSARIELAEAYLYDKKGLVKRGEDGSIKFESQETGYTDMLDMDSGVAKFLATDMGKSFLPAKEVTGSGQKGGKAPVARDPDPTKAEEDEMISAFFLG